ncbi:MAG: multidrug effflux MFS transporter [Gammaproteobacteria bacterium]|nr:multidrug effflux MFS transporter [Gammaproteobacteria bacterium]
MLNLHSLSVVALLALAVALGPLATDMFLPALPGMGQDLGAGVDQMQLTLSLYLVGFALAQLICGPLSDRFGRKPVLIGGMLLFAVASLGCAWATDIETLLLCRVLQALGGATGPVLGRAAVRDIHTPADAARIMAYLATIMAIAPALAPTLGSVLLEYAGWHAIFIALAVYALAAAITIATQLPEPLRPAYRQSLRPARLWANYRDIALHPLFRGYALIGASLYAGLFAFLSGSAFVLIDDLGVSPQAYGLYFALVVAGYVIGNLGGARLSRRLNAAQLVALGVALALSGGLSMVLLAALGVHEPVAVILPHTLYMIGVGLTLPQNTAAALTPFPRMAGSASALLGFVQMSLAAMVGALVGHFHNGTPLVMALGIAGCALAGFATHRWMQRAQARLALAG